MFLYQVGRIILSIIFLWSGIGKLADPVSFGTLIQAYGLIPQSWIMPVAIILSSLEIIAGVGLLLDIRGSLSLIAGLLAMFMVILSYGIRMGLDIDCGCFGISDPEATAFHGLREALYRDIGMMLGIMYLYYWRFRRTIRPVRLRNYLSFSKRRSEA